MKEITEIKRFIEKKFRKTEKICKDLRKKNNSLNSSYNFLLKDNWKLREQINILIKENYRLTQQKKPDEIIKYITRKARNSGGILANFI